MQIMKRRSDAIYLTEMGAFIARRITLRPALRALFAWFIALYVIDLYLRH
ncbi:hypothetical protein [Citrobacter portucalensis]